MPLRVANKNDTVRYRNASGESVTALVVGVQLGAPAQPASSTATTGGTLAAATYSYRVSAVVDGIETTASTAKTQVTTGATSTVTVDWTATAVPAATAHKVYGRTGGSELLMGTVNMPTTTFLDTGSVTPAGALPTADGRIAIRLPHQSPHVLNPVLKATTMKQTGVYQHR